MQRKPHTSIEGFYFLFLFREAICQINTQRTKAMQKLFPQLFTSHLHTAAHVAHLI